MGTNLPRQHLSEHDVLALLNFELSAYDDCRDCRFTCIKTEPAADGPRCNWSAYLDYGGRFTERSQNIAMRVVDEVRERFNVA